MAVDPDKFCPHIPCDCEQDEYGHEWTCNEYCICDVLAKAREDERSRVKKTIVRILNRLADKANDSNMPDGSEFAYRYAARLIGG